MRHKQRINDLNYSVVVFFGLKVLDGMLFTGLLSFQTKPGFTAVDTFESRYQDEYGMYLLAFL